MVTNRLKGNVVHSNISGKKFLNSVDYRSEGKSASYTCTIGLKRKKIPIYFNTNYRTGMKLVSIIMDYCQLQFDALKFFFGVCLHGVRFLPNFNFFIQTRKFDNEVIKFIPQIAWIQIFTTLLTLI